MFICLFFVQMFITKSSYFCVGSNFMLHPHTFVWGTSSLFSSSSYFCVGSTFILMFIFCVGEQVHTSSSYFCVGDKFIIFFILILLRGGQVHYFFHPHTFAWGTSSYFMFCVVNQLHVLSSYFCVGYILSTFSSSNFCVEKNFIFMFIYLQNYLLTKVYLSNFGPKMIM